MPNIVRPYAVSCILIEKVTFYFPFVIDIYGHEYEVLPLLVRIEICVCESNNAGSLEHQANTIYVRLVLG